MGDGGHPLRPQRQGQLVEVDVVRPGDRLHQVLGRQRAPAVEHARAQREGVAGRDHLARWYRVVDGVGRRHHELEGGARRQGGLGRVLEHRVAGRPGRGPQRPHVDGRAVEVVVVGGQARHRQQLAAPGVHDHQRPLVGVVVVLPDRVPQDGRRLLLELEVEAEPESRSRHRGRDLRDGDRDPLGIDQHALVAVASAQYPVVLALEARAPDVGVERQVAVGLVFGREDTDPTQDRPQQRPVRVAALLGRDYLDARQAGRGHSGADVGRDLRDLQRQRLRRGLADLLQRLRPEPGDGRQLRQAAGLALEQRRHHEDLGSGVVHGQRDAVAVLDHSPWCRQPRAAGHLRHRKAPECGALSELDLVGQTAEAEHHAGHPRAQQPDHPRGHRAHADPPEPALARMPANPEHETERGQVSGGGRAPVAEQREGDSGQRGAAEVAGDRDGHLRREERGQGARHQGGLGCGRQPGRRHQAPDQHDHRQEGEPAADEPPLLDQAGEGEVGLAGGQVLGQELVDRRSDDAVEPARRDRDVGLERRPAGALVVVGAVQERVQPGQLVGAHEAQREGGEREGDHSGAGDHFERNAREKQHRDQDHAQESGGAQVRLHQRQHDRGRRQHNGSQHPEQPRPQPRPHSQHVGQDQEQAQLGQLGRLQDERPEGQPALGAVGADPHRGDRQQHRDRTEIDGAPQPGAGARAGPVAERHQPEPDDDRQRLVESEVDFSDREQVQLPEGGEREDRRHEVGVGVEERPQASRPQPPQPAPPPT